MVITNKNNDIIIRIGYTTYSKKQTKITKGYHQHIVVNNKRLAT